VADCPDGYTENGNGCIPTELCHSTCGTCAVKNDANQCSGTCSSTLAGLNYAAFATGSTVGQCVMTATNNAQLLMSINKDTVLGTSELKSVTYNTLTDSTSGKVLNTFLYTQNVI
jgi:hypothetical protein